MPTFIKLTRRGMNQNPLGEVVINADSIVRMERSDDYHLTDIYLKDGKSYSVAETVDTVLDLMGRA